MKVHWTETAQEHLEAIYGYIANRIIYYIKPDQIDILAVIHGSRNVLGCQ